MHITISRHDLLHAIGPIQAIIETKLSLPILSHLLLETSPPCLSVSGTDLNLGIRTRVPGQILREGSVALSAKKLHEIVRELPTASVDLTVDENLTATLTCGGSEFRLKGLPRDDFPSMREPTQKGIVLDRRLFCDMIRRTLFAVSSDPTRCTLNGILFRIIPTAVTMAATDGHRFAMTTVDCDFSAQTHALSDGSLLEMVIPRKAAAEALKLLREESGEITIETSENHLLIQTNDTLITARLIEGQFPRYEQIIPVNATKEVTVNREALIAGLRRTSTILDERGLPTALTLTPGTLFLNCRNIELGEAREHLDVEYQHEEMSVGFNARYLLDFLGVLTTEQATIRLQDPLSSALFAGKDDPRYTCVIMPIRL
jgi:DNA polymerase-3 subunit beta